MANAITVKGVKKYFGDVKALDGVDLDVAEGTVYALLGPNGAGKTTLVRLLATLLKPTAGEVLVGGVDSAKHPDRVRPMIGLAGQSASVDEFLTGRENLVMVGRLYHLPKKEARVRADKILKQLSLEDASERAVKTYSGGMRRRLDLGASLVGEPEILFLDEPTTGLDPRTRLELWDIIRTLVRAGTTIMLTTQYLDEADALAHKIGVIDQGKLIAEGTADELKNRLGGDMVEFRVQNNEQGSLALKAIKGIAKKKPSYDKDRNIIRVPVVNGSKSLVRIASALTDADIEPSEMSLHRPSLDDVFMALTDKEGRK